MRHTLCGLVLILPGAVLVLAGLVLCIVRCPTLWALPVGLAGGIGVCGAAFLAAADCVARVAAYPVELPVGVVTALTGAPFFLYLLVRR